MLKALNITREYITDLPHGEQFSVLESVVSAPYNNSRYSTFGRYFLTEPVEFIFMAKWVNFYRPAFADINSTKVIVRLYKNEGKSKIVLTTQTNPVFIVFFIAILILFLISFFIKKDTEYTEVAGGYFIGTLLILGVDRFVKNILVASVETDLKLK